MPIFRRFNIGVSPYANYDVAVVDRFSNTLVFASLVGYSSAIGQLAKEVNRNNNVYIEGGGYSRVNGNDYEVEKKKQTGSDFMHMITYKKDKLTEDPNKDERLVSYIYYRTDDERIDRMYDKLYKNTAIPIIKEWMPYLISIMARDAHLRDTTIYYDTTGPRPFYCQCLNITKTALIRMISSGLNSGILNIHGSNHVSPRLRDIVGIDSYLNTYGETLAEKIQQSFIPKFIPGESTYDSKVNDYDDSCYEAGIEIYEAQKAVIQANVNNLRLNDVSFVIGEMGTGKTLIGAGITYAHNTKRGSATVVLCPSHLTNKWKREIERFVPNSQAVIVKNLKQLKDLEPQILTKNKRKNIYIIVSKETAKFGYEMRPAAVWSQSKQSFVCPCCNKTLTKTVFIGQGRYRNKVQLPFNNRDFIKPYAYNQVCENTIRKLNKETNMWEESICNEKLWMPLNGDQEIPWIKLGSEGWVQKRHVHSIFNELSNQPNLNRKDATFLSKLSEVKDQMDIGEVKSSSRAPRKYPLAKYIRNYYKGFIDYFIGDEVYGVPPYAVMCMLKNVLIAGTY